MIAPTVAQFKTQFSRDFPYGASSNSVMDSDITTALTSASFMVNEGLFSDEPSFQFAYNYLAAHYLVTNIKNSTQGLGGSFSWLESSKSVGAVSQSFAIPEDILKHPVLAMISKTGYGATYLSLVLPLTYGQVAIAGGGTLA